MNQRVLLVDDDPGVSEVVGLLLEREGYAVESAATLKEALTRVDTRAPDVVVTDLKLPDGTGLDVIAVLRGRHPGLPIVMITSYSSMESAIAALRAGAVDYVIKPFNNDEFLRAVARALNRRRQALPGGARPLAIEEYIREVVERNRARAHARHRTKSVVDATPAVGIETQPPKRDLRRFLGKHPACIPCALLLSK
jgi:DNA-binding NtrC family response regulator